MKLVPELEPVSQSYRSPNPDPHQNVIDPQHWFWQYHIQYTFSMFLWLNQQLYHEKWQETGCRLGSKSIAKRESGSGQLLFSPFFSSFILYLVFQAGRSSSRLGAAAAANLTTSCAWLIFTGIDAGIKISCILIRIRIQYFKWIRIQSFDDQKTEEKSTVPYSITFFKSCFD